MLPLHVCLGMADKPAKLIFDDQILGKRALRFCGDNEIFLMRTFAFKCHNFKVIFQRNIVFLVLYQYNVKST